MGGDHKCTVCQATFTRPQHVARHMRSHTGDRPYKCQYCGDQFARSDLLSRHVNKCHANEKPAANASAGGRRKGSASASRATTSKQACDQCVQSSLPCDGCNPCSKCISRKCRCTYVKFHRQTAPSGPGHHNPRPASASSSLGGSGTRIPSHLEDFILAPPPASVPSMGGSVGSDPLFTTPFSFNPGPNAYPPNTTAADMGHLPVSMASDADMAGKYRAQAELLRRAGPSILSNASGALPGFYTGQQQQNQPPNYSWYGAWGESGGYPSLDDAKGFEGLARSQTFPGADTAPFSPEFYGAGIVGSAYRPRRASVDLSDSSSVTSHSVPSSAASSNVHLPLPGGEMYENHSDMSDHRDSIPSSQSSAYHRGASDQSHQSQHQQPRPGEGGFSSAFGLMSIDDPNVLAGLSTDGVPFFSNVAMGLPPHSPNATPMPPRVPHQHQHQGRDRGMSLSALPTPGLSREMDTRELKDFWRAYMRTPLSGPGSGALDRAPSSSSTGPSQPLMPTSPSGQRRRVRVSSLPSVTPTVERGHPLMMNGHGHGESSGMRTTLHGNPEDLRSYEAAVNARNAGLKLNLVPRRKGTRPSSSASPPVDAPSGGVGDSRLADHGGISRPSSSSSASSLAHAFGVPASHHHAHPNIMKPPPMQGASISLPVPHMGSSLSNSHSVSFGTNNTITFAPGSRESSVASDGTGGTGGSSSDGEVFRPSFKRLPSQTLGPSSSKRALVERGGAEGEDGNLIGVGVENGSGGGAVGAVGVLDGMGIGSGSLRGSTGSRPIAALPERARRASESGGAA